MDSVELRASEKNLLETFKIAKISFKSSLWVSLLLPPSARPIALPICNKNQRYYPETKLTSTFFRGIPSHSSPLFLSAQCRWRGMFSGQHGPSISTTDSNDYDFDKQENAAKWKGVFITSLKKVRPYVYFVVCLLSLCLSVCLDDYATKCILFLSWYW